jgi:hypothetical protein
MLKIELNLSADDLQSLVDALERYVSDLSMEIADTDTMDYRDRLKSQRISIYKVIDQLKKKES